MMTKTRDWIDEAVEAILDDLQGRRGIGDELGGVDEEVMADIRYALKEAIRTRWLVSR